MHLLLFFEFLFFCCCIKWGAFRKKWADGAFPGKFSFIDESFCLAIPGFEFTFFFYAKP